MLARKVLFGMLVVATGAQASFLKALQSEAPMRLDDAITDGEYSDYEYYYDDVETGAITMNKIVNTAVGASIVGWGVVTAVKRFRVKGFSLPRSPAWLSKSKGMATTSTTARSAPPPPPPPSKPVAAAAAAPAARQAPPTSTYQHLMDEDDEDDYMMDEHMEEEDEEEEDFHDEEELEEEELEDEEEGRSYYYEDEFDDDYHMQGEEEYAEDIGL